MSFEAINLPTTLEILRLTLNQLRGMSLGDFRRESYAELAQELSKRLIDQGVNPLEFIHDRAWAKKPVIGADRAAIMRLAMLPSNKPPETQSR